jgi:two-component system NtrC family sensor kinase
VLPAIARGDRSNASALHDETEKVLVKVIAQNEQLNAILESKSASARARARSIRERANLVIIGCFALSIVLSAAVGAYLLRSITRPMAILRRGVERVGDGDLRHSIDLHGRDEFAGLARSFNQMTRDLAAHHAELLEAHRLASIGQVASGVAHEINNPLGVILGYTRILRGDPGLRDREELSIIEDEVRQAQRIVAGLLDLARPVRLQPADLEVGVIVREAVARLGESGQAGGVTIAVAGAAPLHVIADEDKVRQIVVNLIVNAIEAVLDEAASAREVIVRWSGTSDGGATIEVLDRGPGIDPQAKPRLFEPFFSTKAKGHGLGLAIARTLARAHEGDVVLESRDDGPGARARITLPKHLAGAA